MYVAIRILFICIYTNGADLKSIYDKEYSVIKEIDGIVYVGGMNRLLSLTLNDQKKRLEKKNEEHYSWGSEIMNGSAIGVKWTHENWPMNYSIGPSSVSFDNCLNWKQEHPNKTVRDTGYDFFRWYYYSPSGDFKTMNYTCQNSFIKAIEPLGDDKLWVCGTFGAFPRAFSVNRTNLKFINFIDLNVMSCARYVDEPMATYVNNVTKELYVASGWGLYRPDRNKPDIVNNNSTMLYSQWRLYRNSYTIPSSMSVVLSSDVNFIDVVKETDTHIYFFGHEINSQYGLNNQDDRNAWQSFMLRICKNDPGFKYVPREDIKLVEELISSSYNYARFGEEDFKLAPNYNDIQYIENLPEKNFVTSLKVNFGCYISKRPRAISDNHFWGETNVVYLNKLADVVFDPNKKLAFQTQNVNNQTGCKESVHSQIPLLGLFNGPGIVGSGVEPTGALCQLQINENIFSEKGSNRTRYNLHNTLDINDAFEELMAISSTSTPNFFEKTLHRTNGFTMYPWWNQGVMIGKSNIHRDSYKNVFGNIGKCQDKRFYDNLTPEKYLKIQNFTNTAWPNEMANRMVSLTQAMCQYYAAELFGFNATFIVPGVEFKKMFVIRNNITDYVMHSIDNETDNSAKRRFVAPLMVVGIISTNGMFYRVVVCDFDSGIANKGKDQRSGEWYNWCIFRHTNQPYLYRQFIPMERRQRGEPALYRASSLLLEKTVVESDDVSRFPINRDPQFHVVKGVLLKGAYIHVLTSGQIHPVLLDVECSTYTTCVSCASDPVCMWNVNTTECNKYESSNYTDSEFVQDVLDRGFKCIRFIKVSNIRITQTKSKLQCANSDYSPESSIRKKYVDKLLVTYNRNIDTSISPIKLHCNNTGFWRGNIIWKNGANEINKSNHNYVIDGNYLYTTNNNYSFLNNTSCHGVKVDFDKLFNGKEYDWIKNWKEYNNNEILLNNFVIVVKEEIHSVQCVDDMFVLLFIIFIPIPIIINVIILAMWLARKIKKLRLRPNFDRISFCPLILNQKGTTVGDVNIHVSNCPNCFSISNASNSNQMN